MRRKNNWDHHSDWQEKKLRYVYMIEADNRGSKSLYYGQRNILYTGETNNISRRLKEHLRGSGSNFLKNYFPDAQKKLVYVEQLWGDESEALTRETQIKKMRRDQKDSLVKSEKNDLIQYVPVKAIILRKFGNPEEQECIRL